MLQVRATSIRLLGLSNNLIISLAWNKSNIYSTIIDMNKSRNIFFTNYAYGKYTAAKLIG